MKILLVVTLSCLLLVSCGNKDGQLSGSSNRMDTIQTGSGLKYFYQKRGSGPMVQSGSRVGVYLSLTVNDSVVWNTDELPDSLFSFWADSTKLIKGFTEVSLLLREGDEIVAILPDSLAYGDKGKGELVPANAILIYDKFRVVSVDEPGLLPLTIENLQGAYGGDEDSENAYMGITEDDVYYPDHDLLMKYELRGDTLITSRDGEIAQKLLVLRLSTDSLVVNVLEHDHILSLNRRGK